MKTFTRAFIVTLIIGMSFTSCKQEVQEDATMQEFFEQSQPQLQTFEITAGIDTTIIGEKGTSIHFYPNSLLTASGQPATGTVHVEIREMLEISDMVLANTSTTSNGRLLISGGQFYLRVFQDAEDLKIYPFERPIVTIPANPLWIDQPMNVFYGTVMSGAAGQQDLAIDWVMASDSNTFVQFGGWGFPVSESTASFNFPIDSFYYINCDYFYNDTTPLTTVNVILPEEYIDSNTSVQMVFPNINAVTALSLSSVTRKFCLDGGYGVPLGLSAKIVVVSAIGSQYYHEIIPVTTTNGLEVSSTPVPASLSQIQTAIQNL